MKLEQQFLLESMIQRMVKKIGDTVKNNPDMHLLPTTIRSGLR